MFTSWSRRCSLVASTARTAIALLAMFAIASAMPGRVEQLRAEDQPRWTGIHIPDERQVFRETLDFDKRPQTLNELLRSFRQTTNGGVQVGPGYFTLEPNANSPSILVRQVSAGCTARFVAQLEFATLRKVGDKSDTQLGFVLSNLTQLVVELQRERSDRDHITSRLRVSEVTPRMQRALVDLEVPEEWAAGTYALRYHHGLLSLERDEKTVLLTYVPVNPNTAVVAGVRLGQLGVPVTARYLELVAAERPSESDPVGGRAALESTATSARLFADSQLDAAQSAAQDAVGKWSSARGAQSMDVSNALFNLATIQVARKLPDAALGSYAAALKIREQQLGTHHPLTAELHVAIARIRKAQGNAAATGKHVTAALQAYEHLFGRESDQYTEFAESLRGLSG